MDYYGRRVNARGYLIDDEGNIIDALKSQIMFPIHVLEDWNGFDNVEIPFIFRSGLLFTPMGEQEQQLDAKMHVIYAQSLGVSP